MNCPGLPGIFATTDGKRAMGVIEALDAALAAERDRWVLWLPVALGAGIGVYFALPAEPGRWWGPLAILFAAAGTWLTRRRCFVFLGCMAAFCVALGFTAAVERARGVAAPVLERPTGLVSLSGRIAEVESLDQGVRRLLLDGLALSPHAGPLPLRVRIRLQAGDGGDLRAGQRVTMAASLMPPPMPAAPGGFDFARQAWFQRIGAVGYALDKPMVLSPSSGEAARSDWRERLANLRSDLTARIVTRMEAGGVGASTGWVAAALITAERGPVAPSLLQAYRDAGLAHILVIAGMHMSMVAGLVFVLLRGCLAAIPAIALRYAIKKWTAAGALLVTFGYLVISGAPVPTQRAFMMNALVLGAMLVDREALSLRSLAIAATVLLALRPEVLVSASFQMSFAAVLGLIAGYEALGPRLARWRQRHRRIWFTPVFYVAGILLTTQIAGTATALYTVFHFNRFATYGLVGNFLAVPMVGFWVMPSALAAFLLMPFGLDGPAWISMGWGIRAVSRVATWVAGLPGASVDLPSLPMATLLLFTFGGLWLCLWRTRWRLFGLVAMILAFAPAILNHPPDLLIGESGRLMAARDAKGDLRLSPGRGEKAVRSAWIRQAGQGAEPDLWIAGGDDGPRCDRRGCAFERRGRRVAIAFRRDFPSCRQVDWLAAAHEAICPGLAIPPSVLHRLGAHALWLEEDGIRVETVRGRQGDRLWSVGNMDQPEVVVSALPPK